MVKEKFNMLMVMFMRVNGLIVKKKDKEFIYIVVELNMKENGLKILNLEREQCIIKMEIDIQVIGLMTKNKVKVKIIFISLLINYLGKYVYKNGDYYEGNYNEDLKSGKGIYRKA